MKIDKGLIKKRFTKSFSTYSDNAFIQKELASELTEAIQSINPKLWGAVLEVGCGTGFFTRKLLQNIPPKFLYVNDLLQESLTEIATIATYLNYPSWMFCSGDAESISLPKNLSAVVSSATIQWLHHPTHFIKKVHQSLSPKGLLAYSSFGENNFKELQETTQRQGLFFSLQDSEIALKKRFKILHSSEREQKIWFHSPMDVLKHIKSTGVSTLSSKIWTKQTLEQFVSQYRALYGNNLGAVPLSYHTNIIIAKRIP